MRRGSWWDNSSMLLNCRRVHLSSSQALLCPSPIQLLDMFLSSTHMNGRRERCQVIALDAYIIAESNIRIVCAPVERVVFFLLRVVLIQCRTVPRPTPLSSSKKWIIRREGNIGRVAEKDLSQRRVPVVRCGASGNNILVDDGVGLHRAGVGIEGGGRE